MFSAPLISAGFLTAGALAVKILSGFKGFSLHILAREKRTSKMDTIYGLKTRVKKTKGKR